MPWVLPRYDQLLRDQRQLKPEDRQSKILLTFERPIPRRFVSHFQLIQLTPAMFSGGEDGFYQAEIFQPHRVARTRCPLCSYPMDPVSKAVSKCRNRNCQMVDSAGVPTDVPTSQYEFHRGPNRGVIAVITLPEFVVHREKRELHGHSWVDESVDRALLVLDRRYHSVVLAAVKRTAAIICEQWGWGLK